MLKYTNASTYYPKPVSRVNNFIGFSNWAGDGYATGYVDEFRYHQKALTTTEIAALYNSNTNPTNPTPYLSTVWGSLPTVFQYAKWIWSMSTSAWYAPSNADGYYHWFYYTFYFPGAQNTGNLYVAADDYASVYFNNTNVTNIVSGYSTTTATPIAISINNGLNYIRIASYNGGGPAGLICAVYDSGANNIANTNDKWAISMVTNSTYKTTTTYNNTNGAYTFSTTTSDVDNSSSAIPSGVTGGSPAIYYPFWVDTKDYSTGTGVSNATLNGTTPPSISSTTTYAVYSNNSLFAANASCNMSIPSKTINTAVGFTVCFWYYLTSSAAGMIWTINSSTIATRVFVYNTGNQIRVTVNYAGSPKAGDNDIYNLTLNTWTFIALVQPAGGIPYVSLNNGTTTNLTNYGALNFASSYHFLFGDPFVTSNYGGALGYMNNFYYFNRALSAAEITAIYNQ